jgi:hypothetical protein
MQCVRTWIDECAGVVVRVSIRADPRTRSVLCGGRIWKEEKQKLIGLM